MVLHTIKELNEFKAVVDSCEGNVWMTEGKDTFYNLKSELTQYVVFAKLLEENDLELFAATREDEHKLLAYLCAFRERHMTA